MKSIAAAGLAFAFAVLAANPAVAQTTDRPCKIMDVSVFENRVHVQCGFPPEANAQYPGMGIMVYGIIKYFAVESTSPIASAVVAMGATAQPGNRTVIATFHTSEAKNPAGCLASDCRRLAALRMFK